MCGINGFTFEDEDLIKLMNEATKHRGPDGVGIWHATDVTLGHNRLSIIDTTNASSQPMKSSDGRYILTYNGELYNFKELKKEMVDIAFKTTGDTEVILQAYIKWGKDCVKKFNGMFAFGIWDTQEKSLFLARDHAGIKPLYYSLLNDQLIFSSEIKGILEWSEMPRKLSRESFSHYMRLLYVPEPLTMFENIFKLPQGSFGLYKNGKFNIEKYYNNEVSKTKDTTKDILKNIK